MGHARQRLERRPRRPARPATTAAPALRSCGSGSRAAAPAPATRWSRASGGTSRSAGRHGIDGPRDLEDAEERLEHTEHYWRDWLAGGRFPDHRWRGHLHRSALTLKGLTYAPTGATVAAATTSLPETPQGERNWDYRYCWMRDATFTLWGLHALGFDWEADDFMQFVADLERNDDGGLQIMYGDRRRARPDRVDARPPRAATRARVPVRIGNGAYDQKQNDVFGAVLDSIYLHTKTGRPHPAAAVAGDPGPGQVRDRGLGQARPGHLGGARRAQALRLLEADVLGRASTAARGWPSVEGEDGAGRGVAGGRR